MTHLLAKAEEIAGKFEGNGWDRLLLVNMIHVALMDAVKDAKAEANALAYDKTCLHEDLAQATAALKACEAVFVHGDGFPEENASLVDWAAERQRLWEVARAEVKAVRQKVCRD